MDYEVGATSHPTSIELHLYITFIVVVPKATENARLYWTNIKYFHMVSPTSF